MSHEFQFDHVFTEQDDQLIVFDAVARPAVEGVIMLSYAAVLLSITAICRYHRRI